MIRTTRHNLKWAWKVGRAWLVWVCSGWLFDSADDSSQHQKIQKILYRQRLGVGVLPIKRKHMLPCGVYIVFKCWFDAPSSPPSPPPLIPPKSLPQCNTHLLFVILEWLRHHSSPIVLATYLSPTLFGLFVPEDLLLSGTLIASLFHLLYQKISFEN